MTLTLLNDPATRDWRDSAHCRDVDPDTMQPEVATPDEVAMAKRVCTGCPVRRQCKALADSQPGGAYGIHAGQWFGETPRNPELVPCGWCETELDAGPRGTRAYCNATCRKAAQRAREALSA